eukprot:jgi/Chlat1/5382/Chrsp35S05298
MEALQQQLQRTAGALEVRQQKLKRKVEEVEEKSHKVLQDELHAREARRRLDDECLKLRLQLQEEQLRQQDEEHDAMRSATIRDNEYKALADSHQSELCMLNDKQETDFHTIQQKLAAAEQDKKQREEEVEQYKADAEFAQDILQPLIVMEQKSKDMVAEARRTGEAVKEAMDKGWVALKHLGELDFEVVKESH